MKGNKCPTMTAAVVSVVVVSVIIGLMLFASSTSARVEDIPQGGGQPTEFNAVLASIVQQGLDHLAEYKPVKQAIKSLRQELKSQDVQKNDPNKKKKVKGGDSWTDSVGDILESVDSLFGDQNQPSKKASEVADIFAEYQLFRMDLKNFRVNFKRVGHMASLTLDLMSRRQKLRKNIADSISTLFNLPKGMSLEEPLNILSKSVSMWNTPMGQKLVKPMLDKMLINLRESNFDVSVVKPSVDMLIMTSLGAETQRKLKPTIDLIFKIVDRGIKFFQKSGFGNMLANFDHDRVLRMVKEAYVEVFMDAIEPLIDVLRNAGRVTVGLENAMDVTRRYRNIPGTMDRRFRRGDFNDPVAKANSILLQLERARADIDESREAIAGMHAYPLHHPLQAIEAIKGLIGSLHSGRRPLRDFWPLEGFLRAHPIVKGYQDLEQDVVELERMAKRAIDKTHKIQRLIDHVQNMESVFDISKIHDDIRNILTGYPHLKVIVIFLDLIKGELNKFKEIAYEPSD